MSIPRENNRLRAIHDAQLPENPGQLIAHGLLADEQREPAAQRPSGPPAPALLSASFLQLG